MIDLRLSDFPAFISFTTDYQYRTVLELCFTTFHKACIRSVTLYKDVLAYGNLQLVGELFYSFRFELSTTIGEENEWDVVLLK